MLVRHPQPSARSVLTRLHMLGRSLAAMHGGSGLLPCSARELVTPSCSWTLPLGSDACGPGTFGCSPAWGLLQQQQPVRWCAHAASCLHRIDRHMLFWSGASGEG